ncbi:response regulator [Ramlibacter sp. AN1015]|uniref:response regulator n=1 Tax=Ramlibacter sp. AN1015 TaxID=3133428 RepID=UPI0030C51BBA
MLTPPRPANEARRLQRLRSLALLDTAPEQVLDSLTALAAAMTAMPCALISLIDADRQWFKSAHGAEQGAETPRATSFCGHAIAQDSPFMEIRDALLDRRFADNPFVLGEPHVRHYAGAPLVMPSGERIGTLCVFGPAPGSLTASQQGVLVELARAVVGVLLAREREHHLQHAHRLGLMDVLGAVAPIGIFSTSHTGAVLSANERWRELLGLSELVDGLASGWLECIHPLEREALRQAWQDAHRDRRPCEWVCRAQSAQTRWLKIRLVPADSSTHEFAACGIVADVTETRLLEDALKHRNALLETIIENLPEGLLVLDEHRRVLVSNTRVRQLCQLPPQVVAPGAPFADILNYLAGRPGASGRSAQAVLDEACRTQDASRDLDTADGTILHIRSKTTGQGWNIRTYADVTAERRVQEELRDSELRLAQALEVTGLRLWEYEAGRLRLFSVGAEDSQSHRSVRTGETVPLEAMFSDPAELQAFRRSLDELLRGGGQPLSQVHAAGRYSDERRWFRTHARVGRRSATGHPLSVVGTSKDITSQRRAQAELRAAVEDARQAHQAKADFLSTMSHEIRTPLNGITGLTRVLCDRMLAPQDTRYVRLIESCARTLLGVVDNVLDLSKIEAGQMMTACTETDLRMLLTDTAGVFDCSARSKGLRFELHIAPGVPERVLVDGQRLRQVLMNLLGNAVKFTDAGSVSLSACVVASGGGQRLRLDVADTGVGIDAQEIRELFKRFSQVGAAKAGKYRGTGLGLSIAKELAAMMGGELVAASTVGQGSIFTLLLPCVPVVASDRGGAAVPPALPAPADAPILLVDDDEVNRLVGQALLHKLGYGCVTLASSGRQAVELASRRRFALILMDCRMPEMDGIEATRKLRSQGCHAPIVALSASTAAQDRHDCLEAGMNDYLPKPIALEHLSETLGRWINSSPDPGPAGSQIQHHRTP